MVPNIGQHTAARVGPLDSAGHLLSSVTYGSTKEQDL